MLGVKIVPVYKGRVLLSVEDDIAARRRRSLDRQRETNSLLVKTITLPISHVTPRVELAYGVTWEEWERLEQEDLIDREDLLERKDSLDLEDSVEREVDSKTSLDDLSELPFNSNEVAS